MENTVLKPHFVIDEYGKKSAVLLNIREYERLLETLEDLSDSSDFAKAKKTSRKLISTSELRQRVLKNK
jgi:PHD/YefM family antitoxin component YafN of YafNO toxin-antitoxin module